MTKEQFYLSYSGKQQTIKTLFRSLVVLEKISCLPTQENIRISKELSSEIGTVKNAVAHVLNAINKEEQN